MTRSRSMMRDNLSTRTNLRRAFLTFICIAVAFSVTFAPFESYAVEEGGSASSTPAYVNPDTGYRVVVIDDCDLLDDDEESQLVEDMKPVTEYGDVAFWSTRENTRNEIEQARLKRLELFDYSSATIFVVNMAARKLTIQSYGELYEYVNDSRARSITDNVSSYATKGDYYTAAKTAYEQICKVMEGYDIPEPMKLAGYVILAVIIGFTIALTVAFSSRFNPLREPAEKTGELEGDGLLASAGRCILVSDVAAPQSSNSSSGGCGGGGGGCGGGCGGGGSSSF